LHWPLHFDHVHRLRIKLVWLSLLAELFLAVGTIAADVLADLLVVSEHDQTQILGMPDHVWDPPHCPHLIALVTCGPISALAFPDLQLCLQGITAPPLLLLTPLATHYAMSSQRLKLKALAWLLYPQMVLPVAVVNSRCTVKPLLSPHLS
jgi:hypothetical protein